MSALPAIVPRRWRASVAAASILLSRRRALGRTSIVLARWRTLRLAVMLAGWRTVALLSRWRAIALRRLSVLLLGSCKRISRLSCAHVFKR